METKAKMYVPTVFRVFQGFEVVDVREWRREERMELVLERLPENEQYCARCGEKLGRYHDRYLSRARHLSMMRWSVSVVLWREKRYCPGCKKVRSAAIPFICPSSPHITMDLAWWLSRLFEISSVLAVSRLESIDKQTCYEVDKCILVKLLQGYRIPKVRAISVDEVYARSPRQQKEDETRDDLFLTVIVDLHTRKVIWVSQSRRKEALDEFFRVLGAKACSAIEVVACDQHAGYSASAQEYCPQATIVWDRFHLVQKFNEALNEDRRAEWANLDPDGKMAEEIGDLMANKYRYVFLTKAANRTSRDRRHVEEVSRLNRKVAQLELIKEHFHKMFDCDDVGDAQVMLAEVYQWAYDAGAVNIWKWVKEIRNEPQLCNY